MSHLFRRQRGYISMPLETLYANLDFFASTWVLTVCMRRSEAEEDIGTMPAMDIPLESGAQ